VIVEFGHKFSEFPKQLFVIDNADGTHSECALSIAVAKAARFRVVGYYFQLTMKQTAADSRERNRWHLKTFATVSV
jgi:hypothetical protein